MTIIRYYKLEAAEGAEQSLIEALGAVARAIAELGNPIEAKIFKDPDALGTVVFMEYWASVEEHRTMGALLNKELFRNVLALLRQPPESRYLIPPSCIPPT